MDILQSGDDQALRGATPPASDPVVITACMILFLS